MGNRWKDNSPEWNRDRKPHPSDSLYEVFTEGLGNFVSGTDNEIRREQFIRAHNADCDDYEARIAELTAEVARVKAESLRVVKTGQPIKLADIESVPISEHTNTFTTAGADWRIYAAERRVDGNGHRYMMPVSDEWPPIAFSPDTIVQPVRLERWEEQG